MTSQGQAVAVLNRRDRLSRGLPVEVGFLAARGVPTETLHYASMIAAVANIDTAEVLIRHRVVTESSFYRALASELGIPFEAEPRLSREANYPNSILAGLAPHAAGRRFVVAPRGPQLLRLLTSVRLHRAHLVMTTPTALRRAVFRAQGRDIAEQAAHTLRGRSPQLSCREGAT